MGIDYPSVSPAEMSAAIATAVAGKADASAMTAGLAGLMRTMALYASTGEALVGLNSSTRATMIAPGSPLASVPVPANRMPNGSTLFLFGQGLIGAMSVGPGAYNLIPHVTPAGGSKQDMTGFSRAPLLGADGVCYIFLTFTQVNNTVRPGGFVLYGVDGAMPYLVAINPGTTGTQPATVVSDSTVDRNFGCDGFWQTASSANYTRCRQIFAALFPMVS